MRRVSRDGNPRAERSGPRGVRHWPTRTVAALALALLPLGSALPPRGPVLADVLSPRPGAVVGLEGVEVLVRFRPGEATAPETFRALLNGADVTDLFQTGENGAYGRLHALLEGENVLRIEVFGRAPWRRGRWFEQAREVHVRLRPPLDASRG